MFQSGDPGTYTLRQLCATVGQVQFVLPHIYPLIQYEVYSQEPQLTVEPLSGQFPRLQPFDRFRPKALSARPPNAK